MFPADLEMGPPPNVYMSLIHLAGEFWREEPLMGQDWGLYAIAPKVMGGCSSRKGTGSMLESLVSVLLFDTIPNVIS